MPTWFHVLLPPKSGIHVLLAILLAGKTSSGFHKKIHFYSGVKTEKLSSCSNFSSVMHIFKEIYKQSNIVHS